METELIEITTNLDDTTGECIARAMTQLLAQGARDAWWQAITMKHGRPGVQLSILVTADDATRLSKRILIETGSLGCRQRKWTRVTAERTWITVQTEWGDVRIKQAWLDGTCYQQKPEWKDCEALATKHSMSTREVQQAAIKATDNPQPQ